jgi:hypothetical protein
MRIRYTKEDLERIVPNCISTAQVLNELGIVSAGGNYHTIRKYMRLWGIDTSHFKKQGWNGGMTFGPKRPIEEYLSNKRPMRSWKLKHRLLKDGLLEYRCSNCTLEVWLGKPIPLELHHIDGDSDNNALENLILLCPNCHALTDTYRGKNIK